MSFSDTARMITESPEEKSTSQTVAERFATELADERSRLESQLSTALKQRQEANANIKTLRERLAENERAAKALTPRKAKR